MPNHTQCKIVIEGTKKDLDAFLKKANTKDSHGEMKEFTFQAFVPMPESIYRGNLGKEEEEKYGKENCWYDWSIDNWGTKWDCYQTDVHRISDKVLVIFLQTAWSPPMPVVKAMSEQFPNLYVSIAYIDEGMAFAGKNTFLNGEEICVEYYTNWDHDKEPMKDVYSMCHGEEYQEYNEDEEDL